MWTTKSRRRAVSSSVGEGATCGCRWKKRILPRGGKISHHRVVYFYFIIIAIAVKNIIISFHVTYQSKFCIFFTLNWGICHVIRQPCKGVQCADCWLIMWAVMWLLRPLVVIPFTSHYCDIWNWFTSVVKYAAPHNIGHVGQRLWQPRPTNHMIWKCVVQSQLHC